VESAANGAVVAGRDLAGFDLLVTDTDLREMSGKELAARLLSRCPDMKVLYLSGDEEERAEAKESHGHREAVLRKPFSPWSLARSVRSVLDAR